MGSTGWDPYCEQAGTLWLIHWLLLAPISSVPVWWIAFNEFPGVEFSAEELHDFVVDFANGVADWNEVHPPSVRKDVDCLIRMYTAATTQPRTTGDEAIDCPFRDLGLIRPASGRRRYRFVAGEKPGLPPEIAAYAALDFLARTELQARTVTLSRLVNEPGSPGRAFRLAESAYAELLERAARSVNGIQLVTTNGVTQLTISRDPAAAATDVLAAYFGTVNDRPSPSLAGTNASLPANAELVLVGTGNGEEYEA
jgi:hypothetical protein